MYKKIGIVAAATCSTGIGKYYLSGSTINEAIVGALFVCAVTMFFVRD